MKKREREREREREKEREREGTWQNSPSNAAAKVEMALD